MPDFLARCGTSPDNTIRMIHHPPRRSRRAGPVIAVATLVALVLTLAPAGALAEERRYRGRRVVDVLRQFQEQGLELVFSSAVVARGLRVRFEPEATEPRAVLDEILPPLGLRTEDGPAGSILIVPLDRVTGNVRGHVFSGVRGRPIDEATVRLVETGDVAVTAPDGSFEFLDLPIGTYEFVADAKGFFNLTVGRVRVTAEDVELTVELRAQPTFVTEVVVTPNRHSVVRQEQVARHTLSQAEAVLAPTVGGDVTRIIELLPGVTASNNSATFNVRGSVASDVSMVLDGLELYDPFHLQGFQSPFSLIDSNIVDRMDFFGGGFTVDYGDRHGGFVDISTAGPQDATQGQVEVGTLNSRVSFQAPLSGGSGAWMVSARAWYPEAVHDTTELGAGEGSRSPFRGPVRQDRIQRRREAPAVGPRARVLRPAGL